MGGLEGIGRATAQLPGVRAPMGHEAWMAHTQKWDFTGFLPNENAENRMSPDSERVVSW